MDKSSTPGIDYALEKLKRLQSEKEENRNKLSKLKDAASTNSSNIHGMQSERKKSDISIKALDKNQIALMTHSPRLSSKDIKARVSPSLKSKVMLNKFNVSPSKLAEKTNLSPDHRNEVNNSGRSIFTSIKNSLLKSVASGNNSMKTEENNLPNITKMKK